MRAHFAVLLLVAALVMNSIGDTASRVLNDDKTLTVTPDQASAPGVSFAPAAKSALPSEADDGDDEVGGKEEWPELVGMDAQAAKSKIEEEREGTTVYIVPAGSAVTLDFKTDRVRVYCDQDNKVSKTPKIG